MNTIFKIKQNASGQSVVTSELTKNKGKTASLLLSTLLGLSAFSIATPISVQGYATSENAVAVGSNSYATAVDGIATGQGSIATGQGFNREDFAAKVNEQSALLNDQATAQGELETIKTNLENNDKTQDNLEKQIDNLTNIINRKEQKSNQLDTLNNELTKKIDELSSLQDILNQIKSDAGAGSSTGDKTIWTDFISQLSKLNWNNLSNDSNGTTGVNKVASELKSMVEKDYPSFSNWKVEKYEEIISGYLNLQGLFDSNQDNIGTKISENNDYLGMKHTTQNSLSNLLSYDANSNKGTFVNGSGNKFTHTTLVNYLDNQDIVSVPVDKIDINSIINMTYESVIAYSNSNDPSWRSDKGENTLGYAVYNLKNIINSDDNNAVQYIAKSYFADSYTSGNNSIITTLLELPPILDGEKARLLFTTSNNLQSIVSKVFSDQLATDTNSTGKAFVSNKDVNNIRNWLNSFYDHFYHKVDLNADESKWLFDKNNYITQLDKVENFASTLRNYVAAYDDVVANPQNTDAQIRLVTYYNQIREQKNNQENYFENINVKLKQSTIDLWNEFAEKSSKELTEYAIKLKLYDSRNEVIKGVTDAAKKLQEDIDNAQKTVDDKQREIDEISKQIDDLALTPEEKGAVDLKAEKEKELADKKAEKEQFEKDKAQKEDELNKLNEQLANSSLKDLGLHSQAHGSESFASGDDSIAMGTRSTVTANDGIAIGRETLVTGKQSIAIGAESVVTGDKSIAIGVGHTVSGNRSTTSGVQNVVSGNDNFVAGNNNNVASNNVMVMGNSVTVSAGFDGAVVLGDKSTVSTANPTPSITIQDVEYKFAGTNPTSVVSVGSLDGERQIINVAAGRISETSTDAINGSQLYSAIEAINSIKPSISITAGDNIKIDGKDNDFTISAIDTNTQSVTKAGQGVTVDVADNAIGTKDYTVSIKATDGLTFDDAGNLKVSDTLVKAGDNVVVTGNAKDGFTISTTDTNTQATVSAESGITVTESDNANGTKNYAVAAKLGKGLKIDDNGAMAATAQPIKGGAGVTVTVDADEVQTVNVVGVTTTTDEGKSHTRSDLTKFVGVKGDRKNIRTTTAANGDVRVSMSDDIQVNSVSIHNGPNITQNGINANNTRVTNVQDGISPTDAVNVRQLNQQGNVLNQRIDNLANNVKKNKKRADAGIAATAAMSNIPQVMLAGKSGVGVGVGNHSGQTAVAVGYSRASDNAKHIIKLSAGVDTQSKATFGAGYMYQW